MMARRDEPGDRARWEARYADRASPDEAEGEVGTGDRDARPDASVGAVRPPSAGAARAAASDWVVAQGRALRDDAVVLDLACGAGRHARALAARDRRVVAVDFVERAVRLAVRDRVALHGPVLGVVADAARLPFASGSFDAIVCVNFLDRALFRDLVPLLRSGGRLIYETFTASHLALVEAGRAPGPRNPAYLLAPGELPTLVAPLAVLEHAEEVVVDGAGERHVARVVAERRD